MGVLHHAFTGTGAVAIAVAGAMTVGADVRRVADEWIVDCVRVSRSARRLMSGVVYTPA